MVRPKCPVINCPEAHCHSAEALMCRPYLVGNRFEAHIHIVEALMCIVPSVGNSTEAHIGVAETPQCYFALLPPAPRRRTTAPTR